MSHTAAIDDALRLLKGLHEESLAITACLLNCAGDTRREALERLVEARDKLKADQVKRLEAKRRGPVPREAQLRDRCLAMIDNAIRAGVQIDHMEALGQLEAG